MQNITIDKTELDVIYDTLLEVSKNKEITENELKIMSDDLYHTLFDYRDAHADSPLKKPVCYSLIDIFKELKFGRPAESQIYLQKCIDELNENI
jgi:hypothetical protein